MKIRELWDKFQTALFIIGALTSIILFFTISDVRNFIGNILMSAGVFIGSMFKLKPPDILLVILILGILVWLFLLNKKVRGSSGVIVKKPISIKDFMKRPKYLQYMYILFLLGEHPNKYLSQGDLWSCYKKAYPDETRLDFNTTINFLCSEKYIALFDHRETNETCYEVTSKSLDMIEKFIEEEKES